MLLTYPITISLSLEGADMVLCYAEESYVWSFLRHPSVDIFLIRIRYYIYSTLKIQKCFHCAKWCFRKSTFSSVTEFLQPYFTSHQLRVLRKMLRLNAVSQVKSDETKYGVKYFSKGLLQLKFAFKFIHDKAYKNVL